MYRLKEWSLKRYTNGSGAHGRCYGNPGFDSGMFVNTSRIERVEVENEEERLKLFTKSGSCYILEYADIDDSAVESTQNILDSMGAAVDLQNCIALKEERRKAVKKKLAELLNVHELYIVMAGAEGAAEAYFKREDGVVIPVSIIAHTGMFQDSIIVADGKTGLCDFRVFTSALAVTPYHWSDNLEAVHIENVGEDFVLNGSDGEIPCMSGTVTVIKREESLL